MAKLTEEDYVEMADVVDDLKAGIQVVDSVGQLIEDSKTEVERVIESEFSAIFTQLEERETALLERAKAISDSKLSALAAHEAKLEKAMGALPGGAGATADEAALAQCAVEPRETLELALRCVRVRGCVRARVARASPGTACRPGAGDPAAAKFAARPRTGGCVPAQLEPDGGKECVHWANTATACSPTHASGPHPKST
jgi:hypothetical protein